jgi:hypothetical protein
MAEPRTPLERLAKLQATPVPRKMVPTVKSVNKPGDVDPNDPWGTIGTSAAANVPGNKPFVGPTLDPQVIQERTKLKSQEVQARQAGVDPAIVQSIATGQGDPNRGFLGLGKGLLKVGGALVPDVLDVSDIPLPGTKKNLGDVAGAVALKGLSAASPALNKLDFGRRFVVSTLKEVGDELAAANKKYEGGIVGNLLPGKGRGRGVTIDPKTGNPYNMGAGGFSVKDWWSQLSDETNITGGDIYGGVKNPYANQLLGFVTDVFTDPLTFASGPGGIAKTAVVRGTITSATKTGARIAARAATAEADQFGAALARKVAQDALDDAIRIGDNVAAEAAEDAIALANKKAADAAKKLAGDAAGRTMGRTSNQALAGQVLKLRDDAQKVVDLGIAGKEELAFAQRTVDVLNDGVIKNIQTSGLAGIAGPYVDILKGVRTPAQDVLGVRGGFRIVNPLAVFGGPGPLRAVIPGTERITNVAGKLLTDARLGLFKGPIGPLTTKVLNNITPTGEGGILGSADLLELRTGLRRGGLSPQEATQATRLLELDQQYRALVNNERKVAAGALNQSGLRKNFDKETLNEVIRLRQTSAMAGTPVALNPTQQAAADAIDKIFDYFYNYAAKASRETGYVPPRRTDYFPQMQSDEALRWAQKFPKKAEELAKKLKVDRTWFVGNFRARDLAVGDEFFGKVLTQADIDGGVTALNNIARKWGLKFDYFDTDVLNVIGKYAQKHAQFSALQKTIGSLPETLPTMAARKAGTKFVTPKTTLPSVVKANPEMFRFFDPTTGTVGIDALVLNALAATDPARLKSFVDDMTNLSEKSIKNVVDKKEFETLLSDVELRLTKIRDDIASGVIDIRTAAVASDEARKEVMSAYQQMLSRTQDLASIPETRWTEYAPIVKKGFEILNDDIIDPTTGNVIYKGTAPDIAVREELADLLRNAERMNDPEFAARARQLALEYTRFSKAWLTARPGFHTRNALSNVFQLIAAGADPRNLFKGSGILSEINKGLEKGLAPRTIATALVDSGKVEIGDWFSSSRRQVIDAIEDTINYSSSTGFGQYGEIFEAVGKSNRGIRQLKEVGKVDLKQPSTYKSIPSTLAGKYLQKSRAIGEGIENYSRFGLMWDGLAKGLSPQEAVARSNKYLVDYADLSNVDRIAKQIIPFWTFMSRNTPLQLELMWTNPRAYALYSNLKRNIEGPSEEEGGLVIPGYEKDRGVFPLKTPINIPGMPESIKNAGRFAGAVPGVGPALGVLSQFPGLQGDVIRPGLPFPGGGENVLKGLIDNPKGFLASTNPLFRVPLEAAFGVKLFTGAPIAPKGEKTTQTKSRLIYLGRELFSTSSPLVAVLKSIEPARQNKFIQEYFGITEDDAEPVVQTVNSVLSLLGLPLGTQRTQSSVNELKSRFYDLEAYIKDAKDNAEIKRQENIEQNQKNVSNPDDPWGVLTP